MKLIQLGVIILLQFIQPAWASPDEAIARYMAALAAQNYQSAALELVYPEYPSEEALQERQQYVTGIITNYHDQIGALEDFPVKGQIDGAKSSLTIGGGDEEFTMMNPPTDFRRVVAQFSKAGVVYITFMLVENGGESRVIYLQYDYGTS
jgi:hypothetical protein